MIFLTQLLKSFRKQPNSKGILILVALCVLYLALTFNKGVSQVLQAACTPSSLSNSSLWKITNETIDATILWQKTENRPRAPTFSGDANSNITASHGQVLYWWDFWKQGQIPNCEQKTLIAFDALTGTERWKNNPTVSWQPYQGTEDPQKWHYVPDNTENFSEITTVQDGYAVVFDQSVIKLNYDGTEQWNSTIFDNTEFPPSVQILNEGDDLYLPTHGKVYQLSRETGKSLDPISLNNVVNYFGQYALIGTSANTLQVIDTTDKNKIFSINLPDSISIPSSLQLLRSFTARYGNILLLFYQ